jgi:hypothetical protein
MVSEINPICMMPLTLGGQNKRAHQALLLNGINYNHLAWIEGTAIFVAVFLVATISSFVDYKKEVQFVKSRLKSEEKNVVSTRLRCLPH